MRKSLEVGIWKESSETRDPSFLEDSGSKYRKDWHPRMEDFITLD